MQSFSSIFVGHFFALAQTPDPFRGMHDAVFRPNRWHSSSSGGSSSQTEGPSNSSDSISSGEDSASVPVGALVTATIEPVSNGTSQANGESTAEVQAPWIRDEKQGRTASTVEPFLPDERVSLEEAVWMYTVGGAHAAYEERRLGAIQPGFLADLTIVEVRGGLRALVDDPR